MKIKSQKDFFSGVLFTVVGAAFALGAAAYPLGSAAAMGPGYVPLALGVVLAVIGIVLAMAALVVETETGDPVGRWGWRPLCFVLLANLAFGVLLGGLPRFGVPAMGLIVAVYALVLIASLAASRFRLLQVLMLATALALGCYVAFGWALALPMQMWPRLPVAF